MGSKVFNFFIAVLIPSRSTAGLLLPGSVVELESKLGQLAVNRVTHCENSVSRSDQDCYGQIILVLISYQVILILGRVVIAVVVVILVILAK